MEAKSARQRWTYSEFARLPSEGSTRYEVIGGELFVTPAPTPRHQAMITKLISRLFGFAEANDLGEVLPGPVDVLFAEGNYFEPDVVFVGKDQAHLLTDRGIEGPPQLVVEILSPSTAPRDRGIKLERYRHFGVPVYWVVDPDERTVEVWDLAGGATEPATLGPEDTLRWTPRGTGATLDIVLGDLFALR
jgi:Uma2 family endonuclease